MSTSPQPSPIGDALLRTYPNPLYIVDRDSVVRQANPSASELQAQLGLRDVLPREVRRLVGDAIVPVQPATENSVPSVVTLPNGQTYLTQIVRLEGILDPHDGWAVSLVNVTRLAENLEVKSKTLRTLSHEVKTPLTAVRLSLLLLLEEKLGALNPDQRELLEVGRDECERLLAKLQSQI